MIAFFFFGSIEFVVSNGLRVAFSEYLIIFYFFILKKKQ